MNTKLEHILENHGTKIFAGGFGLFWGIGDIISSGYPILSIVIPFWEIMRMGESLPFCKDLGIDWKEGVFNYTKGLAFYSVGASIPFAIKYNEKIIDYIQNLI